MAILNKLIIQSNYFNIIYFNFNLQYKKSVRSYVADGVLIMILGTFDIAVKGYYQVIVCLAYNT